MQGDDYRSLSNIIFGVDKTTVCTCIHDVTYQILRHMFHIYIRLPTAAEALRNMEAWRAQTGIPNVFGAICHVPV
jgi:hypothetical protein